MLGFLQWLIIDVDTVLGLLHPVDMGSVANILEIRTGSALTFDPEDGGSMYLRNIGALPTSTWCDNLRTE
jgi:hypothetical protein